ncbi:MAG TPA: RNA polymerase sigma factor [Thermoanaerobaculia bacterium]|nr:RNA polymerase sigma factor [Thermoanaerobaculia bacterium]
MDHESENPALAVHRHEPGAFDRLVETWEHALFNYVRRILLNDQDAQEVVQDTFIRAHHALTRQYTAERCAALALRPWLFRIGRNLAYNKRRDAPGRREEALSQAEHPRFRPLVPAVHLVSELEKREEIARLDRAIAGLPSETRELIALRFIEEMSYGEIAKTTGFTEASLRGKIFRSLRLLRDALAERGNAHAM